MKRSLLVSLVSLLLTFPLSAEELMRLQFDLDGDGRAERVVLETRPGTGEFRRKVVVKIAGATYETEYINDDVLPPALAVVRLDWQRPQHQLMLTTYDPCCCNYHFLAYRNGRLVRLRSDENHSCELPKPKGGGDIEVPFWDGFWVRSELYRLTEDGLALSHVADWEQWVNVGVAAGKNLVLESPECPARAVPEDLYVWIHKYDTATHRYWLESANGGCGWLPAADLETPKLKHIRWAG